MARKHRPSKHPASKSASRKDHKPFGRKLSWLWIGLVLLLIIVAAIFLVDHHGVASPANPTLQTSSPSIEIQPTEAYAKYQQGAFFLDVRSQAEWDQFHVPGSTLIPLDQLRNRTGELPKDKDIVVVCLTGHRSQSGATFLVQSGFKRVFCLSGGLEAWVAAGYPVEGDAL